MLNEIKNKEKDLQKHIPENTAGISFKEFMLKRKKRKKYYFYIRVFICVVVLFAVGNYAIKPMIQGETYSDAQTEDSDGQGANTETYLKETWEDMPRELPNSEDQADGTANELPLQEAESHAAGMESVAIAEETGGGFSETVHEETTSQQIEDEEIHENTEEMVVRTLPVKSIYTMAVDGNGIVFYCSGSYSGSYTIYDTEGNSYELPDRVERLVCSPNTGSIYAVSCSGNKLQTFLYDGQTFVPQWEQAAELESLSMSISLDFTMPASFLSTGEMVLWDNRRADDMEIWILNLDTGNSEHCLLKIENSNQAKRYYSVTVLNDNFYLWTDLYEDSADVFDREGNYMETYTDSSIVGSADKAYYSDGTKIWIFGNDLWIFQNGRMSSITAEEAIKEGFMKENGKNGIVHYPYISADESLLVFYNANEEEIVWIENPSFLKSR